MISSIPIEIKANLFIRLPIQEVEYDRRHDDSTLNVSVAFAWGDDLLILIDRNFNLFLEPEGKRRV